MIKIRLSRGGKRNDPFYQIVVIKDRTKREGKPADTLGFWHPKKNIIKVDKDKLSLWVKKGAQVTDAVKNLVEGKKPVKKVKAKKQEPKA